MERITSNKAREILGNRFIGTKELDIVSEKLGIISPSIGNIEIPEIPFSLSEIENLDHETFLVLFYPFQKVSDNKITINYFRNHFGIDPDIEEPCLYNQDWYINEEFANICNCEMGWYILRSNVLDVSRAISPEKNNLNKYPPSILLTYFFFANYILNNKIAYKFDFVWTSDIDCNKDQIYVGRYFDPKGVAKNGFSIHRHLSLTSNYASIV
jgi:hypothetical protein